MLLNFGGAVYILELDDMTICWDEDPGEDHEEKARAIQIAYKRNLRHIADLIFEDVKGIFSPKDTDEVIEKLGKPRIYADSGEVVYSENSFDGSHSICFEYYDDEFDDIENITVEG